MHDLEPETKFPEPLRLAWRLLLAEWAHRNPSLLGAVGMSQTELGTRRLATTWGGFFSKAWGQTSFAKISTGWRSQVCAENDGKGSPKRLWGLG